VVLGIAAFLLVIFAAPLQSPLALGLGALVIGAGRRAVFGRHAHRRDGASADAASADMAGLALGAWGAVQTTAAGLAIAFGGVCAIWFPPLPWPMAWA
jgi:BCD family chlorophyll transporter-like MFS transporter